MNYIDIFDIFGFFPVFIILFVFIQISMIFTIIKSVLTAIKSIKRTTVHNFFRSNVVLTNINDSSKNKYKDITLDELNTFNTNDLDGFKNHFYKIFLNFAFG